MTTAPLPNSLSGRDAATVLHPFSDALANAADGALVMTRGVGVHVIDEDGKRYLECMARRTSGGPRADMSGCRLPATHRTQWTLDRVP